MAPSPGSGRGYLRSGFSFASPPSGYPTPPNALRRRTAVDVWHLVESGDAETEECRVYSSLIATQQRLASQALCTARRRGKASTRLHIHATKPSLGVAQGQRATRRKSGISGGKLRPSIRNKKDNFLLLLLLPISLPSTSSSSSPLNCALPRTRPPAHHPHPDSHS